MDIFAHDFDGTRGVWSDPRDPRSGDGALPDLVWPANRDVLLNWAEVATQHAFLDVTWPADGALHYTFRDAWITVLPDFTSGVVSVTSHLLDAFAPPLGSDPSTALILELAAAQPRFAFRRDSYGVTANVHVPARPFVPIHLSQAVLELTLFSEEWLAKGEWDVREFQTTSYRSGFFVPPPMCGNPKMAVEAEYSSIDGHPMWDRPWEWDEDE